MLETCYKITIHNSLFKNLHKEDNLALTMVLE